MRVHHFNAGTLHPFGGRLVDGRPGILRRAELVCHCLLVDTGSDLVLIETGMGSPSVRRTEWLGRGFLSITGARPTMGETAVAQVKRLGYDPKDVRHIVLTHLDLDHAGGLVDFPDATVHVYADELRALGSVKRPAYRRIQFEHRPQWQSYSDTGEPWFGFEAVRELKGLPPQILLVPLAGHTRGHAGVAVESDDGWLLNAGDAYFFHDEIDLAHPYCPPGLAAFERLVQAVSSRRKENQRRLGELRRDHPEVTVFCAHDPVELPSPS